MVTLDGDQLLTLRQVADDLGVSLRQIHKMRARGEGPPEIRLSPQVIRVRESDLRQWEEQLARRELMSSSQAASEDAAELAPQVKEATRCWMNGDHAGWAKVVNESRFPVRVFAAATFNVVAVFGAESGDEERFLDLVAEIVARD
jgi:predicted DNA-binding transcriptional regulator AlpA